MTIGQSYAAQSLSQLWINGFTYYPELDGPGLLTRLIISSGICRDSNNVMDLCLGINNPNFESQIVESPITLEATKNGLNGLDSGSLALSSVYAVYVIGDSSYQKPTGCILSLASKTYPLLPTGYDSVRIIGYLNTNSSTLEFNDFRMCGNSNTRTIMFNNIELFNTAVYTGEEVLAPVDLSAYLPSIDNIKVYLNTSAAFIAETEGQAFFYNGLDTFDNSAPKIQLFPNNIDGTTTFFQFTTQTGLVLAQLDEGIPTIQYLLYDVPAGTSLTATLIGIELSV